MQCQLPLPWMWCTVTDDYGFEFQSARLGQEIHRATRSTLSADLTGLTSQAAGPYSITDMADDAAGLLAALKIPKAHVGWSRKRRIYGCVVHLDINDGKVWIQHDGTEGGIANELVARGIPKHDL